MDIIFLSETKGKICTLGFCHPVHYVLAVIFFAVVVGSAAYFGYSHAKTTPVVSNANYQTEIDVWKDEINKQKQFLAQLKQETNATVDVLSSRIGMIQAHVMRIDALGQRLMDVSDLKGEFDFTSIPAIGGPSTSENVSDNSELLSSIDQLSQQLQDKENQLLLIEDLLLSDLATIDISPTGRPIKKGWLSSYYGMRTHPISGRREMHKGIDFAGKLGDPVVSVAKGIVVFVGKRTGYGYVVDIEHGNNYMTRYAHNRKLLVAVGDKVDKNTQIAEIGTTGKSTGPHVHFEIIKNGEQINPIKYVRASQ